MLNLTIKKLNINIDDGRATIGGFPFVEAQISGDDKDSHLGAKMIHSSESRQLKYVEHCFEAGKLTLVQRSDRLEVTTTFTFGKYNGYAVNTSYKNISHQPLVLEETSAFVLGGFANVTLADKVDLYTFAQSHHQECQPQVQSLAQYGFCADLPVSQRRVAFANVGSWSTKEFLPQGILNICGNWLMFQIESNNSWYYEISEDNGAFYLYLGGKNLAFNGWQKQLDVGESYVTNTVSICFGNSLQNVLEEITKYRRTIKGNCQADANLPTIFNEYMHLSWDCPTEENTKKLAPTVAKLGVEYYVIDCGWHNEEDGKTVYPYVGQWKQSNARFPNGVRTTTDFIRSLGMKAGLWIEPEIIGKNCTEMLDYYDDDCFIRRNGKRVCVMGRYFLDFRNAKVVDYMSETIRRMVEDYGADYIKADYNEDFGIGTDVDSDSFGEGLEQCAQAYLNWIDQMRCRFPQVLFETCSSGGMRMDYQTLKHFSIVSTSDQTHYDKYPYIAGNVLSAVLPEQAAVWSYPVGSDYVINGVFQPDDEWIKNNVSDEQVIMNMINSFLGRMHLASHLEMLTPRQLALVNDGIVCYNNLSKIKNIALPYFPNGFARFGDTFVASGFIANDKKYLAVWNLADDQLTRTINVGDVSTVECIYPKDNHLNFNLNNGQLTVHFTQKNQARFFLLK